MEQNKIKARREKVLNIIVRYYVSTAEPVSSRAVAEAIGLSSASIRSVMFDLERMGFICHRYTSAGRIPTEKGYRFYINFLMEPAEISPEEKADIESIYKLDPDSLEDVIEESSRILSYLSSLAAVVMFPKAEGDRLYFDGAHHILEQPEFRDFSQMSTLLKALEEEKVFLDILKADLDAKGARVRVGSENNSSILNNCSTITARYRMRGNNAGTLGVLGPTRMEYRKLIPMVDYLAEAISRILDEEI